MPNHCENHIVVTGSKDELKRFYDGINENSKGTSILQSYFPCPKELKEQTANHQPKPDMIEKYGFSDWYEWSNANWGTKWGDYDLTIELFDDSISGYFNSAWVSPQEGLVEVSKQFPELEFQIDWSEMGMEIEGNSTIMDGEIVEEYSGDYIHDYNEEENSCGNFERLKEFIILKLSKEELEMLGHKLKAKERAKKEEIKKITLLKWRIFNG